MGLARRHQQDAAAPEVDELLDSETEGVLAASRGSS
jgi:hypothetical protein